MKWCYLCTFKGGWKNTLTDGCVVHMRHTLRYCCMASFNTQMLITSSPVALSDRVFFRSSSMISLVMECRIELHHVYVY